LGGNVQFFLPERLQIPDDAFQDYERALKGAPADARGKDLMVVLDDGVVRFRPRGSASAR
jgi:hypothetical protein